jgi:hypothetical protein
MSEIHDILNERGGRYGEFKTHAEITQKIKEALFGGASFAYLEYDQKEALEMIAHKLGRIVNGDPNYLDSWVDIVGYTQLVIDRLKEDSVVEENPVDKYIVETTEEPYAEDVGIETSAMLERLEEYDD